MSTEADDAHDFIRELDEVAVTVGPIIIGLSNRDSRFLFIRESLEEFFLGEHGPDISEWESQARESAVSSPTEKLSLPIVLCDIVNSAIYEILNTFDIDLTLAQASKAKSSLNIDFSKANSSLNIDLLKEVYQISLGLAAQQQKTILLEAITPCQEGHEYQYLNRLKASNIRILIIQPGLEESSIECQLEERDLESDVIEEVLSYVWGEPILDKAINIDGKPFRVTENLNNILRSLRCQDVPRKIWIDAICINQSDLDEKGHQVRLMREIYSKAQKTTIWLGDQSTKRKAPEFDLSVTPIDDLIPMLDKLGGSHVDRYDLPALYDAVSRYQADSAWDEMRFILSIIFLRCVNIIMRHEWWERVWTVQEAVLPPNDPMIWFCGHTFSYGTIVSAADATWELGEIPEFESTTVTIDLLDLRNRFIGEWNGLFGVLGGDPSRRMLRRGKPLPRVLLPMVLGTVHKHCATDPRDMIFALESLLIKSEGRLINVNYHETTEALFRRITAQFLNQWKLPYSQFHLLFVEHHNSLHNNPPGPSWVYDFTHSLTSREFLVDKEKHQPFFDDPLQEVVCFASPKVLFCSGISVGIIDGIFQIREGIKLSAENVRQVLDNIIEWWELSMAERRGGNQTDGNSGDSERQGSSLGPTREEVMKITTLDYPIFESSPEMYLFITQEGILGRATAPVQRGDVLAIIDKLPHYFILRVAYDHALSQKSEKGRIVARGVVAESQDRMRARLSKGFQSSVFQII
ncbi:heterokaryon incompatibility protein-domain-containing protein [Xylaria scruposa]|nr:heterokaryon incompatibility protein-domain-containing protein [Xylaria scruposa]